MKFDRQKLRIAISSCSAQPFRTKWSSSVKNWGKIAIRGVPRIFSHEMRVDRQKLRVKLRFQLVPRNPFARNEVRASKTEVKLRFQPFRTKWGSDRAKTEVKLRFSSCSAQPFRTKRGSIIKKCVKASVCVLKRLCVKASVCKSVCV